MRFDLATTIPFLLGLCGSAGALAGCFRSCPDPSEYSGSATVHNGRQEEVKKALGDLHVALCDEYCTTRPTGSVCTPTPGELPTDSYTYCDVTYPRRDSRDASDRDDRLYRGRGERHRGL